MDQEEVSTGKPSRAKEKLERYNLVVTAVVGTLKLLFVVAAMLGGALILSYFIRHRFYSGLSPSDALTYVVLAGWFCGVLLLTLFYATFIALPVSYVGYWLVKGVVGVCRLFRNKERNATSPSKLPPLYKFAWRRDAPWWMLFSILLTALSSDLLFSPLSQGLQSYFFGMLALGCFASCLVFGKLYPVCSLWKPKDQRSDLDWKMRRLPGWMQGLFIVSVVLFTLVILKPAVPQDLALSWLGLQKRNVAVSLKKEDFLDFQNRAGQLGFAINPCERLMPEQTVVTGVDVLWHKLGKNGRIRYPHEKLGAEKLDEQPLKSMTMDIDNSAVKVIETFSSERLGRCQEFLNSQIFDDAKASLSVRGKNLLLHDLAWVKELTGMWTMKVTLHTDGAPPPTSNEENVKFDYRRDLILRLFKAEFSLNEARFEMVDRKDTEPKQICGADMSAVRRSFCEGANQRMEVAIYPPKRE